MLRENDYEFDEVDDNSDDDDDDEANGEGADLFCNQKEVKELNVEKIQGITVKRQVQNLIKYEKEFLSTGNTSKGDAGLDALTIYFAE